MPKPVEVCGSRPRQTSPSIPRSWAPTCRAILVARSLRSRARSRADGNNALGFVWLECARHDHDRVRPHHRGRLELALLNLISNGIKYADPDKPHRFVEVTGAAGNDGRCRIAVRDNGIGIPADRLASIFERFTRAHADRDGDLKVTGLGLGLSIAADCARTMGGHLEVESQEHQGTTFVLTLPPKPLSQTAEPSDSPR